MDYCKEYNLIGKYYLPYPYIRELIERFKQGNEKVIYNPVLINTCFYLVIDFEDWVNTIISDLEVYKSTNLLLQNHREDRIKYLLKTYQYLDNDYFELYKIFAKEVMILNEISFNFYNSFIYMGDKITHNHSPKLFLPTTYSDKFKKELKRNYELPLALTPPIEHKEFTSYNKKVAFLLGTYNNYASLSKKDGEIVLNDINHCYD